ncbi:monooxygenase, FAD-binding [hydrothermal vent metagenome]|uniref:Monooxygenase, FAD-binding n=1 Tax=hydrothermal vent metagenome TaxID=652676 RepID=A0A3B0SEM5_9ZZZZ
MKPLNIGIAGAGIGGLAAAAALGKDGHNITIFDQFDTPKPIGSGLVIQPVGQAVLDLIGAGGIADALGQKVSRLLGHTQSGKLILDVSYDRSGRGARHGLAIHRAALFHAVLSAAQAAGAKLIQGHRVSHVSDAPHRKLIFADGTTSAAFDLVIDATGAASPLSPLQARALPFGAIWGTVDWPEAAPLPDTQLSQRYRSAKNMIGVLPIGRLPGETTAKASIFWSLPQGSLEAWRKQPLQQWKENACALWPDFEAFLKDITHHDQMTPAFYSHGTLRQPVARGMVHIGDAAHRASPQLGQGANMALLDAWALAIALRNGSDLPDALTEYHRLRRRHLRIYQLTSAVFTPLYQSDNPVLPLLRDHVLTPLSRLPPMPALLSRLVCGDMIEPLKGIALR